MPYQTGPSGAELGSKKAMGPINKFQRCKACKWGFFILYSLRGIAVRCPRENCGHEQEAT